MKSTGSPFCLRCRLVACLLAAFFLATSRGGAQSAGVGANPSFKLAKRTTDVLKQALKLIRESYSRASLKQYAYHPSPLPRLLDRAADWLTAEDAQSAQRAERNDPIAKLALIAWDRRQHPDIYARLDRGYIHGGSLGNRGFRPGNAGGEELTEPYRLAWEYYLLLPREPQTSNYEGTVANALADMASPGSTQAIRMLFEALTLPRGEDVEPAEQWQETYVPMLARFVTDETTARVALECLEMSRRQAEETPEKQRRIAYYNTDQQEAFDPLKSMGQKLVLLPENINPLDDRLRKETLQRLTIFRSLQNGKLEPKMSRLLNTLLQYQQLAQAHDDAERARQQQ